MRMRSKCVRLAAVVLAVCLLCGCAVKLTREQSGRQLQFYYCRESSGYHTNTGALAAELTACEAETPEQLLAQYLQGASKPELCLPPGVDERCVVVSCSGGVLTLQLPAADDQMDSVLAAACLTLTMTQLDTVNAVCIARADRRATQTDGPYTAESFLLYDAAAESPEYTLRLYYPDYKTGLLVEKTQLVESTDPAQLPALALQALISGTVPANVLRAVPAGTQVLDISVSGGTASVILSEDFKSCDTSQTRAENAVRSITATLCALDEIHEVQLSVIGQTGLACFDITQPVTPEATWYAEQPVQE